MGRLLLVSTSAALAPAADAATIQGRPGCCTDESVVTYTGAAGEADRVPGLRPPGRRRRGADLRDEVLAGPQDSVFTDCETATVGS